MGKRRTRKQKENPKHQFKNTQSNPLLKKKRFTNIKPRISVKRQSTKTNLQHKFKSEKKEVARDKAKLSNLASIKCDIVRSLVQAGLILCLELVLYLTWQ